MKKAMSGHGIVILVMFISFFTTMTGLIPLFLPNIGKSFQTLIYWVYFNRNIFFSRFIFQFRLVKFDSERFYFSNYHDVHFNYYNNFHNYNNNDYDHHDNNNHHNV